MPFKALHYLNMLVLPEHAVVHKNAGKTVADGAIDQNRGYR